MSDILTLEEIKLWRSSTEKLTLEEFAQKLGKNLSKKKETNDLYDIIMHQQAEEPKVKKIQEKPKKQEIPEVVQTPQVQEEPEVQEVPVKSDTPEIEITFKRELAPREKIIFDYLCKNKGKRVLIKELARALSLPNDYVYKYIKNLREKIVQDVLVNADNGGYILSI